eukprot:403344382
MKRITLFAFNVKQSVKSNQLSQKDQKNENNPLYGQEKIFKNGNFVEKSIDQRKSKQINNDLQLSPNILDAKDDQLDAIQEQMDQRNIQNFQQEHILQKEEYHSTQKQNQQFSKTSSQFFQSKNQSQMLDTLYSQKRKQQASGQSNHYQGKSSIDRFLISEKDTAVSSQVKNGPLSQSSKPLKFDVSKFGDQVSQKYLAIESDIFRSFHNHQNYNVDLQKPSIFDRLYQKSQNIPLKRMNSVQNLKIGGQFNHIGTTQSKNSLSSPTNKNMKYPNAQEPGSQSARYRNPTQTQEHFQDFSKAVRHNLLSDSPQQLQRTQNHLRRQSQGFQGYMSQQNFFKTPNNMSQVNFLKTQNLLSPSTDQKKDHKTILDQQRMKDESLKKQKEEHMVIDQFQRDEILFKQKAQKSEQLQNQKDKIERRLLRSKISKTLQVQQNNLCKLQMRKKERLTYIKVKAEQGIQEMEDRYNHLREKDQQRKNMQNEYDDDKKQQREMQNEQDGQPKSTIVRMRFPNPAADYYSPLIPGFPLKGLEEKDPNEILVDQFNYQELQMINEDPNYFIKSDKIRENIRLFETDEDEFSENKNTKMKGKIIKDTFYKQHKQEKVWEQLVKFEKKYGVDHMPDWMHDQYSNIQEKKFGQSQIFRHTATQKLTNQSNERRDSVTQQDQRKKSLWKQSTSALPIPPLLGKSHSVQNLKSHNAANPHFNQFAASNQIHSPAADQKNKQQQFLQQIQRTEELKRQSVLEKYLKKLRQAENQKEEERRKKLTQMIEKRQKSISKHEKIDEQKIKMLEEKGLEVKYLAKVQDQMEKVATKENKMKSQVQKLLPLKLHLKDWQAKLQLNEKLEDSYERRVSQTKEEKFDKLIEQLYSMEWNKLREENAMEFQYMKNNVFKKIEQAENIINNL